MRNLIFLSWFFRHNFFFYVMSAISSITMAVLCIWPDDQPAMDDDD